MKQAEKKYFVYGLHDFPALCAAMVFVGFWQLEKLVKRIRGIKEQPRPKASVRRQNKLIAEIWG